MPTKSGTVLRSMCGVRICTDPQVSSCFPSCSPWTSYQPLLLLLVRRFLLPPQGLCTCSSLCLESSFPLSKKTNTSTTQVCSQVARSSYTSSESAPHHFLSCLCHVFLHGPYLQPKLSCKFIVLNDWCVGVSSPRREASNNEFPCFTLLCCSWDLE